MTRQRLQAALASVANTTAGAVLILLLLDPARPLGPIFVLLAVAITSGTVAWSLHPRS